MSINFNTQSETADVVLRAGVNKANMPILKKSKKLNV
jgi:hypothetical protein